MLKQDFCSGKLGPLITQEVQTYSLLHWVSGLISPPLTEGGVCVCASNTYLTYTIKLSFVEVLYIL